MKLIGDKYKTFNSFFVVTKKGLTFVTIGTKQPLWWRIRWWIVTTIFILISAYKVYIGDFQF